VPELPEVETIRQGLATHVAGRSVASIEVLHPRVVRSHPGGPEGFASEVTGRLFARPARRGKYLWLPFADGDALVVHLRMSGQFRIDRPDVPPPTHLRVRFGLDDGRELRYVDQRMLGGLTLSRGGAELPDEVKRVALDPFDPLFDPAEAARAIRRRRSPVKAVLLNQQVVSGIGNIYADEALWRARLHPLTPAVSLSQRAAVGLVGHATDVMGEALAAGGTSFDALYVGVLGESGYFSRSLHVYGRGGEACPRCGTSIRREAFTNRSSHFCPRCQRRRR
jgi:formamidopyrimidine-DNA glycosylase